MTAARWALAARILGTALLLVFGFAVAFLAVVTLPLRVAVAMSGRRASPLTGWALEAALLGGVAVAMRRIWPRPVEPKYVMHRLHPAQLDELAASIVAEERKRPWPGDETTQDYGEVPF
jgi:hypothetical protein